MAVLGVIVYVTLIKNEGKGNYETMGGCALKLFLFFIGFGIITYLFFDDERFIVSDISEIKQDQIDDMLEYIGETGYECGTRDEMMRMTKRQHLTKECPLLKSIGCKIKRTIRMDCILLGKFMKCDICKQYMKRQDEIRKLNKEAKRRTELKKDIRNEIHALAKEMAVLQNLLDTLDKGADIDNIENIFYDITADEEDLIEEYEDIAIAEGYYTNL